MAETIAKHTSGDHKLLCTHIQAICLTKPKAVLKCKVHVKHVNMKHGLRLWFTQCCNSVMQSGDAINMVTNHSLGEERTD